MTWRSVRRVDGWTDRPRWGLDEPAFTLTPSMATNSRIPGPSTEPPVAPQNDARLDRDQRDLFGPARRWDPVSYLRLLCGAWNAARAPEARAELAEVPP